MGEYVERIGSLGDVHKEESDHDKQGLSRRSFLKVIGGGTAAGAVSYLGAKALVKAGEPFLKSENFPENIASLPHLAERAEVARNMEAQLDEIRKYREELGLTELPRELAELENNFIENFVSVELWKKPAEVKVEMPAISRSYGEVIKDVMEKMYGDKSGRLVNKVYNDEQNPFGIFFRGKGREVSISWTITDIPLYPNFIDFSLHEAAGHGSDPAVEGINYPTSILLELEKGKWKALSRALSIEGQFFHHPGDHVYPVFKKNLGETYAREFVDKEKIPAYGKGLNSLDGPIVYLAQEQRVSVSDIKFNKRACFVIGHVLADAKISKDISFNDTLQKVYNEQMDSALVEIYAEMVKYALVYPDHINNDEDIIEGVKEICQAVSGREDVDMGELRESITKSNIGIVELRAEEENAIATVTAMAEGSETGEQASESVQEIQEAIEQHNEQQDRFLSFVYHRKIPKSAGNLSKENQELLSKYAGVCSTLINKYPTLIDTGGQHLDWEFDPPLHIWEIRDIENAISTDIIRIILEDPSILAVTENREFVEDQVVVMKNFIDSEAFGVVMNVE